ncbi:unnamed protein product, partial [Ixodes persulcatus]
MREGSLTLACLARRRPRRFSSLLFSPLAGAFQFSGLLAEGDRRRNQRPSHVWPACTSGVRAWAGVPSHLGRES